MKPILLKFITIFFFGFCYTQIATAQEYVPIPDHHIWSVNTQKFMTYGDTLINNKEYLKVFEQRKNTPFEFDIKNARYYCALRNDTLNKKVYVVYPYEYLVYEYLAEYSHTFLFKSTDTTEFLLYDFSLNIGDTTSVYEYDFVCDIIFRVKITRVEEVTLYHLNKLYITYSNADSLQTLENGNYRRRILVTTFDSNGYYNFNGNTMWVEGIGSIHGLTKHFLDNLQGADGGFSNLFCYAHEHELLLSTPADINGNCFGYVEGGKISENGRNIELIIYPNPATDFISIKNIEALNLHNCWVEVFDICGKSILKQKYEDKIDVSALKAGYYMLKVTSSNVNMNISRFVKL
jgi:hypothetical protein